LNENYPNDSYVGKSFEIILHNHSNPEKDYKLATISEIAPPDPEDFNPVDNEPEGQTNTLDDDFDDDSVLTNTEITHSHDVGVSVKDSKKKKATV
jgi:hypothetical protein